MTTTTSSSKGKGGVWAVIKQDLRRVRPLTIFYGLLSLLFFPLQYLLQVLNPTKYMDHAANLPALRYSLYGPGEIYGTASYVLFFPLLIIMALLFAAQLVSYMQNKRAVDVYHALPVTRVQMMTAHFAAGMAALGLPLLANFLIVGAIKAFTFGPAGLGAVAMEYICWMITLFVVFGITAFAAVNVGTLFDTAVFALALNGVVPLLYLMALYVFSIGLYGYVANWDPLLRMHPLVLMVLRQTEDSTSLISGNLTVGELLSRWFPIWLGIGLVIMAATIWLYHLRKSESAESLETSAPLKVVIKLAGTFIGAVLLGMLFQSIFGVGFSTGSSLYAQRYFIGGTLIGSVITFLIIEAILARGFKTMRKNLPACLLITCAIGGFIMAVATGGLGYSMRVPKVSDIDQVTVNYTGLGEENSTIVLSQPDTYRRRERTVSLSSPQATQIITDLHQAQLNQWKRDQGQEENDLSGSRYNRYASRTLELDYQLKSGMTMRRQYTLQGDTAALLVNLETNDEFLEKTNPLFAAKPNHLDRVTLIPPTGETEFPLVLTEEMNTQLLEALCQDLLAQTSQQLLGEDGHPVAYLNIEFRGLPYGNTGFFQYEQSRQPVGPSFVHTLALLEKWGYTQQLTPDFSHFALVTASFNEGYRYSSQSSVLWYGEVGKMVLESNKYAGRFPYQTENPQMIEELFQKSTTTLYSDRPSVTLAFVPTEAYTSYYYSEYYGEVLSKEDYLSRRQNVLEPTQPSDSPIAAEPSAQEMAAYVPVPTTDQSAQEIGTYAPMPTVIRFLPIEDIPEEILTVLQQSEYVRQALEDYREYRSKTVPVLTQARLR